jgi:hypothetical protein
MDSNQRIARLKRWNRGVLVDQLLGAIPPVYADGSQFFLTLLSE